LSLSPDAVLATDPPRAFAPLPVNGVIRSSACDFVVEERSQMAEADGGEHLLLWIEKQYVNTQRVAVELARSFAVADVDVAFAGMKDRHALTRQWFSVRTARTPAPDSVAGAGWRVLDARRGARKLRRGGLDGNAFRIRIRQLTGDVTALSERLSRLAEVGVPNYFGEQRFGHDGANIERARAWICRRPRPRVSAFQKGLHLSTARALLFNTVLAARVTSNNWATLLDGDVPATDDAPTGPLWGRGRPATRGCAAALETRALAPLQHWLEPMEHLGLRQERRACVARPGVLSWSLDGDVLEIEFELSAGQYATALMRELSNWRNAAVGRQ